MGNRGKKTKMDPLKIFHHVHRRLSMIQTAKEEHHSNEIASKSVLDFDVSKYVDDNWELDETKIGLFPDDDYALTYRDDPDMLPALFKEDERFVFVDGLIQLAQEPVKSKLSSAFTRRSSMNCSTFGYKPGFAGTD